MPGVRADVALARVACRRDVGPIDEERDARLVHVEPFSEPNDVGERDPVGAADDLAKADASASARARIAALGGRLARDVESSQPIAKLPGLGAWLELGELLGFANRVRAAVAVKPFVLARVDPIGVAAHDALEVRAQHCLSDPRAARHLHANRRARARAVPLTGRCRARAGRLPARRRCHRRRTGWSADRGVPGAPPTTRAPGEAAAPG